MNWNCETNSVPKCVISFNIWSQTEGVCFAYFLELMETSRVLLSLNLPDWVRTMYLHCMQLNSTTPLMFPFDPCCFLHMYPHVTVHSEYTESYTVQYCGKFEWKLLCFMFGCLFFRASWTGFNWFDQSLCNDMRSTYLEKVVPCSEVIWQREKVCIWNQCQLSQILEYCTVSSHMGWNCSASSFLSVFSDIMLSIDSTRHI